MSGGLLPDGEHTNSNKKYVDAWRDFCKPIEEALGLYHWAFNPDVAFRTIDEQHSINLPRWLIKRFNDLDISQHKEYPKPAPPKKLKDMPTCSCFGEETYWLCEDCAKKHWAKE